MSGSTIKEIIKYITKNYNEEKEIKEVTIEANPFSVKNNVEKIFSEFKESGVNRISIGVQSFDDKNLVALDRDHNSYDAMKTIESASKIFNDRFSFDLMFSLPNQSVKDCKIKIFLNFFYFFIFYFFYFFIFLFFILFYF